LRINLVKQIRERLLMSKAELARKAGGSAITVTKDCIAGWKQKERL